jgi:hypothetical protein
MADSRPMIWIPSSVWFSFLAKRLRALRDTQVLLESREITNYGIMTGILTYMMQSVIFTPPVVSSFVRESLALLYFKQVVDRFGMFFLHNLDLSRSNCLPEVLDRDDADILKTLGARVRRKKKIALPSLEVDPDEFPIGRTPTWREVEKCIKERPWALMRAWVWSPHWENDIGESAAKLFQLFSTHIWASLNDNWRAVHSLSISPVSVREAVECWTLKEVYLNFKTITFVPCNAGLQGRISGRKVKSFADRLTLYFPPSTETLSGVWKIFGEEPGYIAEYRKIVDSLMEEEKEALDSSLRVLLAQCQCLPISERGLGKRSAVWNVRGDVVQVLTNPLFYKLETIGGGGWKPAKTRRAPTHQPPKKLQIALLEHSGVTSQAAKRAVNWSRSVNRRRSTKSRNRRIPPSQKPKQKPVKEIDVTGDDDSLEEEGEEGTDNGSETDEDEEESGLSTDTDDD